MAICDAHGAAWGLGKQKQLKRGQGHLLAATFMRKSVIQDKALDQGAELGFSREDYRREIEKVQGEGPWLICDECLKLLNLGRADREAARKAAQQWWKDNNTPGYDPDADLMEGAEDLPQAKAAQPAAPSAIYVGKMHCPRCGAENDAARAACWSCFAQLHPPTGAEARRAKPKPAKPEKKKGKAAPAPSPVAEPVTPPVPIEAEAAPVEPESAPVEIEQAPAEVETAPPVAPLEIPPIMATVEPAAEPSVEVAPESELPAESEPEAETTFVAGIPLGETPQPEAEEPVIPAVPVAEIPAPDAEEVEEEPAPSVGKVLDLDEPVSDSAFVIPGLAEPERKTEPTIEPGEDEEDVQPLADLGGTVLDLDAEEPEDKPDDKKPKDKT